MTDAPLTSPDRPGVFRRYVWNRNTLGAILLSSPAILSAGGSLVMSQWVDGEIAVLNQRRDQLADTSAQLDGFKERVETFQLNRAAMLLLLGGMNADQSLRYALDKLFRLNAQDSMRRVAALLYPTQWKEKMKPYEDITTTDYADIASIRQLQDMESAMIQDAARALTALQAETNVVAAEIDRKTSTRTAILVLGNSLMYIITILIFFVRTARTDSRR